MIAGQDVKNLINVSTCITLSKFHIDLTEIVRAMVTKRFDKMKALAVSSITV